MSQLQYKNENQNYISNFVFQFIKKKKKLKMALWVPEVLNFYLVAPNLVGRF